MKRSRRSFPYEFKKMIVDLAETGQYSLNQVARDHDISPGLILQWRAKLSAGQLVKEPTFRERQLEAELEAYKKKVGEMTIAIDVIKKHLNTFQSVRKLNLLV